MRRIAVHVSAAALVLILSACSEVSSPAAEKHQDAGGEMAEKIDEVFAPWDEANSPGVAVAVIRDGEIIVERGYGSAQLEYGVDIEPDTAFHFVSVSKRISGSVARHARPERPSAG